jgi:hypothetical protein
MPRATYSGIQNFSTHGDGVDILGTSQNLTATHIIYWKPGRQKIQKIQYNFYTESMYGMDQPNRDVPAVILFISRNFNLGTPGL